MGAHALIGPLAWLRRGVAWPRLDVELPSQRAGKTKSSPAHTDVPCDRRPDHVVFLAFETDLSTDTDFPSLAHSRCPSVPSEGATRERTAKLD